MSYYMRAKEAITIKNVTRIPENNIVYSQI